ncbi:uncharacterized protein [Rhodnius prolixus]|uniref:uncharacterized protein n=1 Tax=Rhodnius prolixus TaxID=13249 RepID=UPI003D18F5D5
MFPLKTLYAKEIENWLTNNPTRIVRKLQVSSLFCGAYLRAATLETAINGFKNTGINPFNPEIFQEHDFVARSQMAEQQEETASEGNNEESDRNGTSKVVSPREIRDVPSIQASTSARAGTSFLVTGTPHKESLKTSQEKKQQLEERQKNKVQKGKAKKRLNIESDQPGTSFKKPPSKKIRKKCDSSSSEDESQVPLVSTDDDDSSDEDDTPCFIWEKSFSEDKRGEKWVQCTKCFNWCHELCASFPKVRKFICDFCLEA